MKAGTTQKIRISLDVDLNYVDSIIFTLDGATRLTKIYPGMWNTVRVDSRFR